LINSIVKNPTAIINENEMYICKIIAEENRLLHKILL